MDMQDNPGSEDYVLVSKKTLKLSKARKFTILAMVLGAIVSIAGAGTFASFSASTTNDASFSTARLALQNGQTGCVSPAGRTVAGTATGNAAVDDNSVSDVLPGVTSTTDCPTLFPNPLTPGVEATADVYIKNVGDVDAKLYLFAESACSVTVSNASYDMGTATNLCDRLVIAVERTTGGNTGCVFPAASCTSLSQTTPGGVATDSQSFQGFSLAGTSDPGHQFVNRLTAATNISKDGTPQTFRVHVYWKNTIGTTDCTAAFSGTSKIDATGPLATADGFIDSNGQGCDNPYMNQKANLRLKWQIEG